MLRRSLTRCRQHVSVFFSAPAPQRSVREMLDACHAKQVDIASTLSSDFFSLQSQLFKYRIARLGHELAFIYHHPLKSLPSAMTALAHLIFLPCVYVAFFYGGRFSTQPLLQPPTLPEISPPKADDSLVPEEKKIQTNPL